MKKMRGLSRQWNQAPLTNRHQGQLKKIKILGAVLELPAKSTANQAHLPHF